MFGWFGKYRERMEIRKFSRSTLYVKNEDRVDTTELITGALLRIADSLERDELRQQRMDEVMVRKLNLISKQIDDVNKNLIKENKASSKMIKNFINKIGAFIFNKSQK